MSHIFHFSWADDTTPQFEFGSGEELQKKSISFGDSISIEVASNIHCAGYMRDWVWKPCPYEDCESKKCEDCKKKEGLAVAQFCDGNNLDLFSPEQLEQLNTPHYVYLALFRPDVYKVGVSSLSRGFLRQIEQGSHFCLVIAQGMGGVLARQIESFFRKCGVPDKIAGSQRKGFVFPEISVEEGQDILTGIVDKYLPSLLFDRREAKPFLISPPEFHSFENVYHLPDAIKCEKPLHSLTLKKGECVSGTLLAVKGSFLIIETDAEKVLINAKDLRGYEVDFSPKPAGLRMEEAFQGALF